MAFSTFTTTAFRFESDWKWCKITAAEPFNYAWNMVKYLGRGKFEWFAVSEKGESPNLFKKRQNVSINIITGYIFFGCEGVWKNTPREWAINPCIHANCFQYFFPASPASLLTFNCNLKYERKSRIVDIYYLSSSSGPMPRRCRAMTAGCHCSTTPDFA